LFHFDVKDNQPALCMRSGISRVNTKAGNTDPKSRQTPAGGFSAKADSGPHRDSDEQEKMFYDEVPVGARLRGVFGSAQRTKSRGNAGGGVQGRDDGAGSTAQ